MSKLMADKFKCECGERTTFTFLKPGPYRGSNTRLNCQGCQTSYSIKVFKQKLDYSKYLYYIKEDYTSVELKRIREAKNVQKTPANPPTQPATTPAQD